MGMGQNSIKLLRVRRGLKQGELAKRAGMTIETLSRLENDRGPMPRATSVRKIALALGVEPLELWETPIAAREAVNAVADGRVSIEGDDEPEPADTPPQAPQQPQAQGDDEPEPADTPQAPVRAPEGENTGSAPNGAQGHPQEPSGDARAAAARAYGIESVPVAEDEPAGPRRGIELPSPPAGVTDEARAAAREHLFGQLPEEADDDQGIDAGIDAIAQWIYENSEDGSVPAPILRWLTFAWLARVVAPEAIHAGAHDPVDRSDVTNPPRKLLLVWGRADRTIEQRIEEQAE